MIINDEGVLLKATAADVMGEVILIPSIVTTINENAFVNLPMVKRIIIGENVTSIQDHAFADSTIVSLVFPNSVKSLGKEIFYGSNWLQEVKVENPDCIMSYETFSYALSLRKLEVGNKIYAIRSFPDGNVWEVQNKHGYDVVQLYSGRRLFSNDPISLCGRQMNVCVYGTETKEIVTQCNQIYYTPDLGDKYKELTLDTPLTANDYRIITGCCYKGWNAWLHKNLPQITIKNLNTYTMPVREIIRLTKDAPGNKLFTQFVMDRYADRDKK